MENAARDTRTRCQLQAALDGRVTFADDPIDADARAEIEDLLAHMDARPARRVGIVNDAAACRNRLVCILTAETPDL